MSIDISSNIKYLDLDFNIENKLLLNNIDTIEKLWKLSRNNLKELKFSDSEINNILARNNIPGIILGKRNKDIIKLPFNSFFNKNISVKHILCMDNSKDLLSSEQNYNINCFRDILPFYGMQYEYINWFFCNSRGYISIFII